MWGILYKSIIKHTRRTNTHIYIYKIITTRAENIVYKYNKHVGQTKTNTYIKNKYIYICVWKELYKNRNIHVLQTKQHIYISNMNTHVEILYKKYNKTHRVNTTYIYKINIYIYIHAEIRYTRIIKKYKANKKYTYIKY